MGPVMIMITAEKAKTINEAKRGKVKYFTARSVDVRIRHEPI